MPLSERDPCSFSLPDRHVVRHVDLVWSVDFERKKIAGEADLLVERIDRADPTLILDVSRLDIKDVRSGDGTPLRFAVDEEIEGIGSKLSVALPPSRDERSPLSDRVRVVVRYETAPDASGLQWLDPPQTLGKKEPYVFSQFQPIHARSVVPCQDTPAVKFTYAAEVTAPSRFAVLMSALRDGREERDGGAATHRFRQPIPIPSYLLAVAVGELDSRPLSPRCTVWSEREIVERCAREFAGVDDMLRAAEDLCGEYEWGIYDVLVLPPSFPFGGMENPCVSFLTPTLLAGDRSLVDVVVHEIAHSWSGNLVTNRNFEHFWLNEGFTVFLERKISSRLAGVEDERRARDFRSVVGLEDLRETVYEHLGAENPLTKLVVDLKGLNPDDAFSTVPYEKGSTFLRYLEDSLGGPEVFDGFVRRYIKEFRRRSIDTDDFKAFLNRYFDGNERLREIDWEGWLRTPGMPPRVPEYDDSLSRACTRLVKRWTARDADPDSFGPSDIERMDASQRRQFLTELHRENLSPELVRAMDGRYGFGASENCEIKFKWLRVCIKVRLEDRLGDVLRFVNEQGRMKYVRPLYRDLYAWEDVRRAAVDNFLANEKFMMHVSAYTLRKDLHLN